MLPFRDNSQWMSRKATKSTRETKLQLSNAAAATWKWKNSRISKPPKQCHTSIHPLNQTKINLKTWQFCKRIHLNKINITPHRHSLILVTYNHNKTKPKPYPQLATKEVKIEALITKTLNQFTNELTRARKSTYQEEQRQHELK